MCNKNKLLLQISVITVIFSGTFNLDKEKQLIQDLFNFQFSNSNIMLIAWCVKTLIFYSVNLKIAIPVSDKK